MNIDIATLSKLIDISCVRTDATINELKQMVNLAKKYRLICCFAMPCFTDWLVRALEKEHDIMIGGVVGFPSGADTTNVKVLTTKEMLTAGCDEIDMVINVGALKSKQYDVVMNDIKAVVCAAQGSPVKSILEVTYLTEYEIQKASELAVKAGVAFIKSATGWANKPTTVEHIKLIKQAIGDSVKIKAAGGIRDIDTIANMINAGCSRFGTSVNSTLLIVKELAGVKEQAYKKENVL